MNHLFFEPITNNGFLRKIKVSYLRVRVMKKIVVCGACGEMGRRIIKTLNEKNGMETVTATENPEHKNIGKNIGELLNLDNLEIKLKPSDKLSEELSEKNPDVLIDFTIAKAAVENVKKSCKNGTPMIVGTTGFTEDQMKEMKNHIQKHEVPAIISPNMSLGVNTFFKIVEKVSEILKDYDMELVESHHNKKVDSPSGTALKAAEIAAEASEKEFEKVAKFGREKGEHGERPKDEIGIHSVRAGNITGEHNFIFAGPNESLEINHKANSKQAFVDGVIKAIDFILEEGKPGKIQNMRDVLF